MMKVGTTPILSSKEIVERLQVAVHSKALNRYYAMYSSILGGIITNLEFMVLPIDDHMVHRGHGVFDTAIVANGYAYQLDQHLDRFLRSAEMARITPTFPRDRLREIILDTIAATGKRDTSVRYWLSPGPGGFDLSPDECVRSSFFVMIYAPPEYPPSYYTEGLKVITSSIPIKSPYFSRVKSNNYLPNVLLVMEAREKGAHNGIFLDQRGMVGEGPAMNVAFVTKDKVLKHPKFDGILSGLTALRVLELAKTLVERGELKDIVVGDISVEEGRAAAEMMFLGSTLRVTPIVEWDGKPIGDGKPGPIAKALLELLKQDLISGEGQLIPVPYPEM
ncbi:MAG: D-amino-acid transaminase [Candidatus Tectomicrobia bacterium]|nr:D-amino-acid transaminase [Candidatus Tectomicrobia bacterium]